MKSEEEEILTKINYNTMLLIFQKVEVNAWGCTLYMLVYKANNLSTARTNIPCACLRGYVDIWRWWDSRKLC